jgi:hypothetical protein
MDQLSAIKEIFGLTVAPRAEKPDSARRRQQFLGSDLAKNRAQLVKVHRFGKMKIESGFFAAPDVFVRSKSSESYAFNRVFLFCLGNHLVTAAIGKADVAQDNVKFL